METRGDYQNYLHVMQNYQTTQGRRDYQAPVAESFELIYAKAEEQYDFNGNGTAEVGVGKHFLTVPKNMPKDVQEAYISAMNSLSDKEKLMATTLTFDSAHLDAAINNKPYTPTNMDYDYLKSRVDDMLNPKNGGYTSVEAKESITAFWSAFNAAYAGDKTQSTQKQEEQNGAVEKFLHDLRTKGAAKFLADLNQEKIEKMVEEYKQKLIKEMGDSSEAMEKIAQLVHEFKKNLIEQMREKMEEELKNAKDVNSAKIDAFIMTMLNNNMQEKTASPLKELLKA